MLSGPPSSSAASAPESPTSNRTPLRRGGVAVKTLAVAPPRPAMIIFLIAAPIVQILIGTVGALVLPKDSTAGTTSQPSSATRSSPC